MKKILIITHTISNGGGAEKILDLILKFINKEKYNIDILEIKNYNENYNKIEKINYLGYIRNNSNELKERIKDKIYLFLLVFFPQVVYKKFIKKEYDIKISFNYLIPSFLITSISDKSKKICWMHGEIYNLDEKKYKFIKKIEYKILRNLQGNVLKKINWIVSISKKTKESVIYLYPFVKKKIRLVYNGFNFNELKKIGYEKKDYIIMLGRLEKGKNFELAIEVINELVNIRKIEIKLLILGEGYLREKLELKIKKLKLEKNIELKGYIKEPYEYIEKAKLMLVTSFSEGFPTVIVESLALKTPVVSTPVAGTEELLYFEDIKCGEIVDYTVENIANKIESIFFDEKLYKTYQELGYKNVQKFSIENQIKELEKLLD